MKRTALVICVAALMVAAVTYWVLQRRGRNSGSVREAEQSSARVIRTTNRLMGVVSPQPATINVTNLDGTVEQDFADADLRGKMNEWGRDGWAVLSISGPIPQEDGTVRRTARLRPKE